MSNMIKQCSILILLVFVVISSVQAKKLDPEIYEALRCIRMFPYFERIHKIPLDTLHSISLRESGKPHSKHNIRIVWPWTVNVEGQGYYFNTKREAVLFVKKQLLSGKESIDIGCMQVNLKHHPDAFRTLEHAFDPRINVAYGAWFLRSKYDQSGNWGSAIGQYHSATHELGTNYKKDVVKIIENMQKYKQSLKSYAYANAYDSSIAYLKPSQQQSTINTGVYSKSTQSTNNDKLAITNDYNKQKKYRSNLMVPIITPHK